MSDSRRNRRKPWRLALPAIAVAVAITLTGVSSPAQAALTTANCPGLSVIAVRGTDVPAPSGTARNNRVWEGAGYGPVLSRLVTYYKNSPLNVNAMGLKYPANGGTDYIASVNAGVGNLVREINWIASNCPTSSRIVLIGHSQGAQIIGDALSNGQISAGGNARIKAAALFGDPAYVKNQPINAPGNQNDWNGIFQRGSISRDALNAYKAPSPGRQQKVRSWCYTNDYPCSYRGNYTVHSSYLNSTARLNATVNWINGLP